MLTKVFYTNDIPFTPDDIYGVPFIADFENTKEYVKDLLGSHFDWQLSKKDNLIEISTFFKKITILSKKDEPYLLLYCWLRTMQNVSVPSGG